MRQEFEFKNGSLTSVYQYDDQALAEHEYYTAEAEWKACYGVEWLRYKELGEIVSGGKPKPPTDADCKAHMDVWMFETTEAREKYLKYIDAKSKMKSIERHYWAKAKSDY